MQTNAGRDMIGAQVLTTGTQPAAANYVGLTADATAPGAGDTSLTNEIASGGLARGQGTYAHSAGAATFTLSKTFTATSGDTTPVSLRHVGVFNASSSGTMAFKSAAPNAPVVVSAPGDVVTVNITFTVS